MTATRPPSGDERPNLSDRDWLMHSALKTRLVLAEEARRAVVLSQQEARMLLREWNVAMADRRALAKLAADTPQFFNPLDVFATKQLRDEVLRERV